MRRRIGIWLLASLLVWSAAGCGEKNAADGTENTSAYLRLYCPADLSEKNRSAGGGDAVNGIPISWKQVRGDDRGRQQQAQYIMELLLGGQGLYLPRAQGDGGEQLYRHRRHGVGGSEPGV